MPDFSNEERFFNKGYKVVAGVDEAGRGPWAGPVVACAVVLDPQDIPPGLNDSKKLSEKQRKILFDQLVDRADFGIGIVDEKIIDEINILQATFKAMADALASLKDQPDVALIDGNKAPTLDCLAHTIKKGDGISLSIAAASIIAKVTRDELMKDYDSQFPGYGFARHKGYGTAVHAKALARLGACSIHRKSFAPVAARLCVPK